MNYNETATTIQPHLQIPIRRYDVWVMSEKCNKRTQYSALWILQPKICTRQYIRAPTFASSHHIEHLQLGLLRFMHVQLYITYIERWKFWISNDRFDLNVLLNDMQFYSNFGKKESETERSADQMTIFYRFCCRCHCCFVYWHDVFCVGYYQRVHISFVCGLWLWRWITNKKKNGKTLNNRAFPCVHAFCFRFFRAVLSNKKIRNVSTTRGSRLCVAGSLLLSMACQPNKSRNMTDVI